jgi:hypothetical protein
LAGNLKLHRACKLQRQRKIIKDKIYKYSKNSEFGAYESVLFFEIESLLALNPPQTPLFPTRKIKRSIFEELPSTEFWVPS